MKVIGSDFDGTIVPKSRRRISTATRKFISTFREEGNCFVIVTGRSPQMFYKAIKNYNVHFFDYVICANGAAIYNSRMELLEYKAIDKQTLSKVIAYLSANKILKNVYVNTLKNTYALQVFKGIEEEVISVSIDFRSTMEQEKINTKPLLKYVSIFTNGRYLDITPKGVSKASVLNALYKEIKGTSLYTIGDGENDVPMLGCTKNSYSFTYATSNVQNKVNYIYESFEKIMIEILKK